jgi:adenosine kinase
MRILVTGSVAYDVLLGCDGTFRDGVQWDGNASLTAVFLAPRYKRHHGGTGANIAWNLRLLGADPLLVATVGSDGGAYAALLKERGIDTSRIEMLPDAVTSTAVIGTDSQGEQLGFFHAGADAQGSWTLSGDDREDIAYAIVSPREERVMLAAVAWCKKQGVPYIFDPGQRITSMGADDLRRCAKGAYALIANAFEWETIKNTLRTDEEGILALTDRMIVTCGEDGATFFTKEGSEAVAACSADRVVNPTGAGDAFRAGLLCGLDAGWGITDALRLGSAMGSFVVEIEGTLLDALDRDAVWQRAKHTFGTSLPQLRV